MLSSRKSYILSVKPVDFSLTDGTNIPPPLESPPCTPPSSEDSRPPTSGGGPLTSHPTRPPMPGAYPGSFPPSPEPEKMHSFKNSISTTDSTRTRADSLLQQTPPPIHTHVLPPGMLRPKGVRRIFSMSSLRQSFSSSRTSLSQRPDSSYQDYNQHNHEQAPGAFSGHPNTSTSTSMQPPPPMSANQDFGKLRKKRSSGWFRRQSGFFNTNDEGEVEVINEDLRAHKRMKPSPLPMLPEISTLVGDEHMEGSIGWDDGMFKR